MKVIQQSATIVPEREDILKQIEERGRVCYKSEDKITDDSAPKFVNGIIKNGHNSVLEMAVICIEGGLVNPTRFMQVGNERTSASVRAWREYLATHAGVGMRQLQADFACKFPNLFTSSGEEPSACSPFIPMPENDIDHTYVCVRFVTNRAVTHEIVRHRPCSFLQESQRYVRYDRPEGIEFIKPVGFEDRSVISQVLWEDAMGMCEKTYRRMRATGDTPQQARGVLPNDTKTEILVYCNLREWNHIFFMRTQGGADPQMIALMKPLLEEFRVKFPGHFDILKPSVE